MSYYRNRVPVPVAASSLVIKEFVLKMVQVYYCQNCGTPAVWATYPLFSQRTSCRHGCGSWEPDHDDHEGEWFQDNRQAMRIAHQQDSGKYPLPRGYKWVGLDEAMEQESIRAMMAGWTEYLRR